jgi:hypothetical protein
MWGGDSFVERENGQFSFFSSWNSFCVKEKKMNKKGIYINTALIDQA